MGSLKIGEFYEGEELAWGGSVNNRATPFIVLSLPEVRIAGLWPAPTGVQVHRTIDRWQAGPVQGVLLNTTWQGQVWGWLGLSNAYRAATGFAGSDKK